ncbi:TetR/AcrR family transcriptional regulator [Aurantiacibacter spongiae]|uniref:TetR/AcrR family transcriptional regulator n=2 Tax=Aurantiacibacter spongiae TaxID=2488860 RepID=A0A3N5CXE6_9SPHN|nr:TetR/AcrR family transcriptional regulator [Aurantiacibacter spongiae]RPF72270.1 TetR/AcrR family transcriptional regulator [Aurantiacibacter spongiae]
MRRLLDAAALEFGEKGFHDTSISGITARAGTALGNFYNYFGSKEELFRALVQDMSARVGERARGALSPGLGALETERAALLAFLGFASEHQEIYRIIDEAEFIDPASFRLHYETTANRIAERLRAGEDAGELRRGMSDVHAWAIMGMNVFLGLRYAVWANGEDLEQVTEAANAMISEGIRSKS